MAVCFRAVLAVVLLVAAEPPLRWGSDEEGGVPYIFRDPARPDERIGFEVDVEGFQQLPVFILGGNHCYAVAQLSTQYFQGILV